MKTVIIATAFVAGVYIAQNYDVPCVKTLASKGYKIVTDWEKSNKK